EGKPDDDAPAALWSLPARGGEARVVATAPGGVGGICTARDADVVSVTAPVLPSAADLTEDDTLRKARKELKVDAVWHTGYPVRHWDHDLGPDADRRFALSLGPLVEGERAELRQLTGAGRQLDEAEAALSPDGGTLVTVWTVADPGTARRETLVAIDTVTGERRT